MHAIKKKKVKHVFINFFNVYKLKGINLEANRFFEKHIHKREAFSVHFKTSLIKKFPIIT